MLFWTDGSNSRMDCEEGEKLFGFIHSIQTGKAVYGSSVLIGSGSLWELSI